MSLVNEIFTKAKDHLRAIAGDAVEILVKSNQKVVDKLAEIDADKVKRHKESQDEEKAQGEAILGEIKGVQKAIEDKEVVKAVEITNPDAISSDLKELLTQILGYVQAEYEKEEKEINLSNDFSGLMDCIRETSSKGEVSMHMQMMMEKMDGMKAQDLTEMFATVVEAINNKDNSELYGVLCDIRDKNTNIVFPTIMDVNLDPSLVEDNRLKVVLRDDQVSRIVSGGGEKSVYVMTADGGKIDVQHPLPTDGDSVYAKDIDTAYSSIGGFSGSITDLFDNRTSTIVNSSATNPKEITIALKRPIHNKEIALVTSSGSFKNTKLIFKNAAGTVLETIDESGSSTAYTSRLFSLQDIDMWCVLTIQFHTTSAITLSFVQICKSIHTNARLQALKPDGTVTDIDATAGGNLKVSVEEFDEALTTDSKLNTVIYGATGDTTYKVPRVDVSTHSIQTIDYPHHEIHSGSHFFYSDSLTLGNGATQDYLITTPNTTKWAHLLWEVEGTLGITMGLYEAADRSGTTLQTVYNNNRNSATTATTTIHKGQSGGTTDGTNIHPCNFGTNAAGGRGGHTSREEEIMLKQNTKYIFRITNKATTNNDVCVTFNWYEHTDKTA